MRAWVGTCEGVRAASVVVLPFVPASVGVARGRFRAELRSAGIGAAPAADAALVMNELLSNEILHARPAAAVRVLSRFASSHVWQSLRRHA